MGEKLEVLERRGIDEAYPPDLDLQQKSAEELDTAAAHEAQYSPSRMFEHPWVRRLAVGASTLSLATFSGAGEGALALATASTASTESAEPQPDPKPLTSVTIKTEEGSVRARSVAVKKMTLLEDVRLRGKTHMDQCHWTKGGFWNTGRNAQGKIYKYYDSVPGKLCKNDKSPTGFVKVAGGITGRNCGNPASDRNRHMPYPKVKGEVKMLRNLNIKVKLQAVAHVAVRKSCGEATARASVYQKIRLKSYLRKTGNGQINTYHHLVDKAVAKATAQVKCQETITPTVTPTPTPTPTPNRPPTGRGDVPHRYVNSVDKVCVDPSDPDGDPDGDAVSVTDFHFRDTNTGAETGQKVSGVYYVGNGDVQCVDWKAPADPESVTWVADLRDARGATATTPPDEFPVLANDTGERNL